MARRIYRTAGVVFWVALLASAASSDYAFLPDEGEDDYTVQFEAESPAKWPAGASVRIAFDYRSETDGHVAVLSPDSVEIQRIAGEHVQALAKAGAWPAQDGPVEICIKRRRWLMQVLANGRVVTSAHADAPYGGRVGVESIELPLVPDDLLVQPTEPPRFADDFMRGPNENSPWRDDAGSWGYVGLDGGKGKFRPDLSANPFSIRSDGPAESLATAGSWFWDSYRCSVAVKAVGSGGAIGLAFYVQDARNYYLLCLADRNAGGPMSVTLSKVVNGQRTVLTGTTGGYEADLWHRLEVRASDGLIEADIDGKPAIRVGDATFGHGRIGCWSEGLEAGWFDDADVTPWWGFADPLTTPDLAAWTQAGGQWTATGGQLRASSSFENPATIMVGSRQWSDYEVGATVSLADTDGVGLYACYDGPSNYYLFRWADGTPQGTYQLLRMADGRAEPLEIQPGRLDRDVDHRLTLRVANGLVDCAVDGARVIASADRELSHGAAGLRADGGSGVGFREVAVAAVGEPYHPVRITQQFTEEDTMSDWARAASDWPRDPTTGIRWFRLPVFADVSVRVPYRLTAGGKAIALMLGSIAAETAAGSYSPESAAEGLQLTLTPEGAALGAACSFGGELLAEATVPGALEGIARIDKTGPTLRLWIDGEPVLSVNDGSWLDNSAVGLLYDGPAVDPNRLVVQSTHMPEWTFSGAPTDWRPTLGTWQVTDRWSCFPGWAWFGGSKHQSPLVWSKTQFYGDQTFEFWGALEMDTTPAHGGYTHPSDINCTIAGDGLNLCSGYSFVFAGDSNTVTKILKGNQVVAQTDKARFTNPSTKNMNFHRHWFHVKVVKYGPELHMSVDGKWVLNWRDPQPLTGGHAAVWSYNNGILIARARASAQHLQ